MKRFINDTVFDREIVDTVFEAASGAIEAIKEHGDAAVVNGAFGTYFDEHGKLLTFTNVYETFDAVDVVQKAKYASSIYGPPEYQAAVKSWLFGSHPMALEAEVIATPGGTGALASTVKNALSPGEILIQPNIGWGPYTTIAKEAQTPVETYEMFDGDRFHLESFKNVTESVMKRQGKVVIFVNDPCQNPTGYTLSSEEWDGIVKTLIELNTQGPVVFVYDVAYIDFNGLKDAYKRNFERFYQLPENILTVIAFSASKTMTAYGMRVGAQVLVSSNAPELRRFKSACGNTARGVWSTVNNGGMKMFSDIALDEAKKARYQEEREAYLTLLSDRAQMFVDEAQACNLPLYPYHEGFFATIRVDDPVLKNELHLALKKHHIFFVNVYGGLRVALCSIPLPKMRGLAWRVKRVLDALIEEKPLEINEKKEA